MYHFFIVDSFYENFRCLKTHSKNYIFIIFFLGQCIINCEYNIFGSFLSLYNINWILSPRFKFSFSSVAQDTGAYVSKCESSVFKGLVIHIDFYEINSPCTCNVTPKFTGDLFVLSNNSTAEECNTQIKINDDFMFDCAAPAGSNHSLNVQSNQIVHVQAEYITPSKQGMFHQCLQIRQYGKIRLFFSSPLTFKEKVAIV